MCVDFEVNLAVFSGAFPLESEFRIAPESCDTHLHTTMALGAWVYHMHVLSLLWHFPAPVFCSFPLYFFVSYLCVPHLAGLLK